jgi:hypothetical protein
MVELLARVLAPVVGTSNGFLLAEGIKVITDELGIIVY